MSNFHSVWCHQRDFDEAHDCEIPYCYRPIHTVKLLALDGQKFPPGISVYATSAAHPSALTSGERAPDDHLYDGVELVTEHHVDGEWVEQKLRLTSDAARSLAAALVRAADIQQGLTR
ncbi:hypothetical protein [[Mycobacterium] wendilense]|uniref:Uncharacterized protein n=1 Tax=[Mycobacterium] wendilense TaxID=3064284 RepID=A0ABN9NXJ7_9MYCO|nr:hypothetical protein [Mycolicibacterium sp. MU0050]CAJ1578989.1 hypothetical protein MU0050_000281 [Mycolicibacterium sp. MU0050]